MIVAVNAAAVVLMIILAFVGSAIALEGLAKLDTWLRIREGKRPSHLNSPVALVEGKSRSGSTQSEE